MQDVLMSGSARYDEVLDGPQVRAMAQRAFAEPGQGDGPALIAVLMLELWPSDVMPKARGAALAWLGEGRGWAAGVWAPPKRLLGFEAGTRRAGGVSGSSS